MNRRLLIRMLFLFGCIIPLPAQRIKTSVRLPKIKPLSEVSDIGIDSAGWRAVASEILISRYAKPAGSLKETFQLKNGTARELKRVILRIDYFRPDSSQIHSRQATVDCDIPAGEERQITLRSWDPQKNYFFLHGTKPRKKASPYWVIITPEALFFKR